MSNLDLTDFRLLEALHTQSSVSRAAEQIGLSQPAASIRLRRLREHFDDPLFVRSAGCMQPTTRATALREPIRQTLGLFDGNIGAVDRFDPADSRYVFRIATTSVAQINVLPALMERLGSAAPGVSIELSELDDKTPAKLAAGEVHLAIGVNFASGADFYERKLFQEDYVCIASSSHKRIGRKLARAQLCSEGHVVVDAAGTSQKLLEKGLKQHAIVRKLRLRVPSFLGVAQIVSQSELIALVPTHLALILMRNYPIKVLSLPVSIASYPVKLLWHSRHHRDPALQWLRGLLVQVFLGKANGLRI